MITMKEQSKRFATILDHLQHEEKPCVTGLRIPYDNLASVWGSFMPGECYSFFGSKDEIALRLWRRNLLWQLIKNGVPVHVLEGGKSFDADTVELLCLQSEMNKAKLYFHRDLNRADYDDLRVALKELALYPLTWETGDSVPANSNPVVCVKDMTLSEWQESAEALWSQAREQNVALLLFVQMPKDVPVLFESLYHPNRIVRPEYLSSYLGLVKMDNNLEGALKKQQLVLVLKNAKFFYKDCILFDRNRSTYEITPAEKE